MAAVQTGNSSHEANSKLGAGANVLEWQTADGVVSFGTGDLEWVRKYVREQKERHATGRAVARLEWFLPPERGAAEAEPRDAP